MTILKNQTVSRLINWGAVIAIRGTLSLDDCLTDFMCEPADLEEWIASAKPGGLRELSRDPTGKPGLLRKLLSTRTSGMCSLLAAAPVWLH